MNSTASPLIAGDMAWLLTASGLVLLMTPGLALFYGGMVRRINLVSTMFQSFISMSIVSLIWVLVGFSLSFGDSINGLIGNPFTYLGFQNVGLEANAAFAATIPLALFALFQMKFAIITPALVTGAFSDRIRMRAYLPFLIYFSIVIYAPVAHWAWHPDGFLRKMGVLDFAGGTVVHITAGITALVSALVMQRRKNHIDASATNVPFVLLGTALLWFGWFGFNAGSALSANAQATQAFLTTHIASATAMITWMTVEWFHKKSFTAVGACIGAVVGLVAITPAAGFVNLSASLIIGAVSTIVSYLVVQWRTKTNIDDTLDVFPCHGVGGIVGMLLTAVFANDVGMIHGNFKTMGAHLIGLLIVVCYTAVMSWIGWKVIQKFTPLEIDSTEAENAINDIADSSAVFDFNNKVANANKSQYKSHTTTIN